MYVPTSANVARYLRIAMGLWLAYLVPLALLAIITEPPGLIPWFSMTQAILALVVLGLASWQWAEKIMGRAYLPTVIVLMSALPIVVNHLSIRLGPPFPFTAAEGITLRLLPLLILTSALIAWRFQWWHVIGFIFALTLLELVMPAVNSILDLRTAPLGPGLVPNALAPGLLTPLPRPPTFLLFNSLGVSIPGELSAIVEFCILLVVGLFISLLMSRLRAQQASLERANSQLANYASTLEHLAISRERNRVARELHDILAHTLSGLTVQLETIKAYWDVDPRAAQALLAQALDSSRAGVQETRRALKELRASPLDDLGLALAIRQLAESAAERGNLGLEITLPETLPTLTPEIEQCIYRIAQEALENVVHHAGAQHISIQLAARGAQLALEIRDDGQGFDAGAAEPAGHYGLAGMRERAALVGGTLAILSQPHQGTTIQLAV